MAGAAAWTFQVLIGLTLLSYAVNLFIFSVGSLAIGREPIVRPGVAADLVNYSDPLPQSLVLTAIVIGFATTALFLVVLLALRGLSGGDHVDGRAGGTSMTGSEVDHLLVAPVLLPLAPLLP